MFVFSSEHRRSLSSASDNSSSDNDTYFVVGMSIGIISFVVGFIVLVVMEYLKHKVDSAIIEKRIAVVPLPTNDKQSVEEFNHDHLESGIKTGTVHYDNNTMELRPSEPAVVSTQRDEIIEQQKALRQQYTQEKSNKTKISEKVSTSTTSPLPSKLLEMTNAMQQQQQQTNAIDQLEDIEDHHDHDHDDEDDDVSEFSFPSAMSSNFSDDD